jgi:abequosyltransferase
MSENANDMNKNIILSIAIPTYNGAERIRDTLDSIISQLDTIGKKIEIVISDNASTDGTFQIIKEYQNECPGLIFYYINEKNVGFDRNVNLIFKRAKGKYVWLLSDDDTLKEKSIPILLDKLDKYKNPSIFLLNYSECNIDMSESLHRYRQDIHKDIYCENGNIFFQESKFLFCLVSSLVIKRSEWNRVNIDKYIGSSFVHVGAAVEILKNQPSVIISNKLVNYRMGNSRWGSDGTFLYHGFNLVKIYQGMKSLRYEKKTYEYLIDNMYKVNIKAVIIANSQGLKNKKNIAVNMIECYKKYPLFWFIDLPLLMMPNIIYKGIYKMSRIKLFKSICEKLVDKL